MYKLEQASHCTGNDGPAGELIRHLGSRGMKVERLVYYLDHLKLEREMEHLKQPGNYFILLSKTTIILFIFITICPWQMKYPLLLQAGLIGLRATFLTTVRTYHAYCFEKNMGIFCLFFIPSQELLRNRFFT